MPKGQIDGSLLGKHYTLPFLSRQLLSSRTQTQELFELMYLLAALSSRTFSFANCKASSYLHCRIPLICESLDVFAGLDPDIHVLVDLFDCVLMLTFELDILVLEVIPLSNRLVPFTNG